MAGGEMPSGMSLPQIFAMLSPEEQKLFYQGPAMIAPDGVIANFENPQNRDALGYGLTITGAILATMAVAARLYPRLFMGKRITLRLEDYLVMAAWSIFGAYLYYVYSIIISPGVYVHQWDIRYIDLVNLLYNVSAGAVIYGPVICLTKTAILLDWLHIFVPHRTRNAMAWTIYGLIALNCLYYTAGMLADIFGCTPRKAIWDKTTPGTCIDANAGYVVGAVFNVLSDLVILALPQKVIWGLHLTTGKKAGISGLFAIGVFACVCAIFRLFYSVKLMQSDDITYSVSPVGLWSIGEITSGFLIVGVPSVPKISKEVPWVQSVFSWIRSLTGGSSKGSRESSRKGMPSWYKKAPTIRRRQDDIYSELDERAWVGTRDDSVKMSDLEVAHKVYSPHQSTTRETEVGMHSSRT